MSSSLSRCRGTRRGRYCGACCGINGHRGDKRSCRGLVLSTCFYCHAASVCYSSTVSEQCNHWPAATCGSVQGEWIPYSSVYIIRLIVTIGPSPPCRGLVAQHNSTSVFCSPGHSIRYLTANTHFLINMPFNISHHEKICHHERSKRRDR